ncbi:MAG: hypothetical protein IKO59_09750, partial [Bacteroidales bacterium]|nr:hypothetical protein [Bacteroidales bacterium]
LQQRHLLRSLSLQKRRTDIEVREGGIKKGGCKSAFFFRNCGSYHFLCYFCNSFLSGFPEEVFYC